MKSKMMALDVKASVEEVRSLVGQRLLNVYDIGPKFLLLKFGEGDQKTNVLIEVGIRLHITKLAREKPKMPSQFTFKLRKHIKKWRLDSIRQLQGDRTVVLKFGTDQTFFLLVVELYGRGNIILMDHDYVILMLLRSQREGDVVLQVRGTYPLEPEKEEARTLVAFLQDADNHFKKCDPAMSLLKALTTFDNLGPQLAEHCVALSGLPPSTKTGQLEFPPSAEMSPLRQGLVDAFTLLEGVGAPGGVLVTARGTDVDGAASPKYIDFAPAVLKQFEHAICHTRSSFGEVCDQFFLRSEMERIDQHNEKKEAATVSAKDRFLKEHTRRIEKLQTEEEMNIKKGRMLENNSESVQEVIDLMNMLLAMKLGWEKIRLLVKARQREGHAVAYMIHDIHLERNCVTVLLEDDLEEEEEDRDIEPFAVEVDLSMNAQRNASRYYTVKKKVHHKLEKTIASTDKAAAGAERKGQRASAKQGTAKKEVVEQRKTFWYEKFFWFVTSFGDLAVYARDQTQTDTLIRKYMAPCDLFVHCDAARAPICILKAVSANKLVTMSSILEAGSMTVSRSAAWDSKTSMSAWWVSASTVTSTQHGTFVVSGERNYLKPMPLATAVIAVFRTRSEHRVAPLLDAGENTVSAGDIVVDQPASPVMERLEIASHEPLVDCDVQEVVTPDCAKPKNTNEQKKAGISIRSLTQRSAAASPKEVPEDAKSAASASTATGDRSLATRRTQHKLRKIKKKYAEQDDDEREERMKLLGNCPSRVHKLLDDSPQTPEPEAAENEDEEVLDSLATTSQIPAPASKPDRAKAVADPGKFVQQLEEGSVELLHFLAAPGDEDEVLYAVCLCVPSSVAMQYKHRVHITYGQEKKGAAASAIIRHFAHSSEVSASCATALRLLEADQLTNQLPSNIKVHFAHQSHGPAGRTKVHADPTADSR